MFESRTYTEETPETSVWDEHWEVWSLNPDGRLRIVVTTRSAAGGSRVITMLYRRP